ncbi:MAG: vWA domain-containing protein [Flavisolibacter sp.]
MLYNWLQHIEFKYVWVLPLLLVLPLLAFYYYRTGKWRKSSFLVTTAEAFRVRTAKNGLIHLPFWLRLLSIGCILLALARPQIKDVQSRSKGQGIDIILCMDVSGSMTTKDFIPSRLDVSKQMAAEFVSQRPVDQIGLVIFQGESFTQYPLSTDHGGLLEQITNLRSGMLEDGTAIGEGLATSVERLMSSTSRSKVVILLTDGNEQPSSQRLIDPYTALEIAKTKGVKVYTIGMGVAGAIAVKEKGVMESENTFLDENLLSRIAKETGGEYYRATDSESLQQVYQQIDRLEKSEIEVVTRTRYQEQFMYFMMAALFFLALDIILRYTYLRTFP